MTIGFPLLSFAYVLSTHILTRRMTVMKQTVFMMKQSFNSHPHKEDDCAGNDRWHDYSLSTHILTRRMTWQHLELMQGRFFQLTSSQGGWRIFSSPSFPYITFQLTSSQGGWRFTKLPLTGHWDLSTHILTRRMTIFDAFTWLLFGLSTHILTRRMTAWTLISFDRWAFQLTSSQGGWLDNYVLLLHVQAFNSHPHKEDDSAYSLTIKK